MSAEACDERFVAFDCEGSTLIGVLATPKARASEVGIVIVVGGPQYRAGSHRQFVALARALAIAGHPVLRFDYRGMGDSEGARRTFEHVHADLAAAVGALRREAGVAHVVLWGLCDGASAALMSAPRLDGIAGTVAVNPWARSPQTEAATRLRHYYVRRIASGAFWRKLVRGELNLLRAALEFARTARTRWGDRPKPGGQQDFLARMQAGWQHAPGAMLIVLSGRDYTAREFEAWIEADATRRDVLGRGATKIVRCAQADHTFSSATDRAALAGHTRAWLAGLRASVPTPQQSP